MTGYSNTSLTKNCCALAGQQELNEGVRRLRVTAGFQQTDTCDVHQIPRVARLEERLFNGKLGIPLLEAEQIVVVSADQGQFHLKRVPE